MNFIIHRIYYASWVRSDETNRAPERYVIIIGDHRWQKKNKEKKFTITRSLEARMYTRLTYNVLVTRNGKWPLTDMIR